MARLLLLKAQFHDVNIDLDDCDIFEEVDCSNLEDYYGKLECRCFDVANRKIGDKRFDIFCDDEGLFADDPIPSAVNVDKKEVMLVGNLIFANHDDFGETTDLSDDDIHDIKNEVLGIIVHNNDSGFRKAFVIDCDW